MSSRVGMHRQWANVVAVAPHGPCASRLEVVADGSRATAIAYHHLVGEPEVGELVLLNTTAVDLDLGTGGAHFVIALAPREGDGPNTNDAGCHDAAGALPGHLMKLRYTPHQCAVQAAEEPDSPFAAAAQGDEDLEGTPVVACELHSQIPAVAAGFLALLPAARVVYVMTDGAALPLPFSLLAPRMKEAGLITGVVTAGQCFGGDLEAINVYSGLLLARLALKADLIVTGQGPGNAGTDTRFGFSGLQQGEAANAAASLGGRPIICVRSSDADARVRHRTPSHHTLTVLDRVVRCRCAVPIARDAAAANRSAILTALRELNLTERHDLLTEHRGTHGVSLLRERRLGVTTMGRSIDDDREFFLHASAAGAAAAALVTLKCSLV